MLKRAGAGERLASPWVELLVRRMCSAGVGSEGEAWRMRLSRVLWADVALKEEASCQRASILSDDELERLVEMGWDIGELLGVSENTSSSGAQE